MSQNDITMVRGIPVGQKDVTMVMGHPGDAVGRPWIKCYYGKGIPMGFMTDMELTGLHYLAANVFGDAKNSGETHGSKQCANTNSGSILAGLGSNLPDHSDCPPA